MRIDQPRQDNLPTQIEDRIRGLRQLGCWADLLDDSIYRKNPGVFQFPSRIHPWLRGLRHVDPICFP